MAMNANNSIVSVVEGPKKKPFHTKKNVVGSDAREWVVNVKPREAVKQDNVASAVVVDGLSPKKKPFPNRKQLVGAEAGEWIVREVEGKMVFTKV